MKYISVILNLIFAAGLVLIAFKLSGLFSGIFILIFELFLIYDHYESDIKDKIEANKYNKRIK